MTEKITLINNLKVNYKIAGEGPAILVLHGWGGSSDSWIKVQDILTNQGYNVIVPDFPGFGKSITPSGSWSLSDYTKWLIDFINYLKIERFYLVAHSFGGRIAIKFATQYPEKIKSLILCDSAGIKPKPEFKTRLIYWMARIGNAIFTSKHLERFRDGAQNFLYIFLRHKDYIKANSTMKETIKKVLEEDLLPDLSQIKVKTLIVWGEDDKLVPVRYAYIFKEKIENSEIKLLPKIGHSPHLEIPEKLAEIITDFLSK